MANKTTSIERNTPPPRERVSPWLLGFAAWGAGIAWLVQLTANYALEAQRCYPDGMPLKASQATGGFSWIMLAINLAALVLTAAAGAVAYNLWRRTRRGVEGKAAESSHDRTRFIAMIGYLAGIGFVGATAFDLIAFLVVPRCFG